ncbi:MAG: hypothetical protein JWN87_1290 [Frankiales bacterium]|nr:hypothetical protein [Frankiales bacterium]
MSNAHEERLRRGVQSEGMTSGTLRTTGSATVVEGAVRATEHALSRAGVTVLELRTPAETDRAAAVLREVWRSDQDPVPANLLRAVQQTGGYVFGAYGDTGRLLGVSLGLLARDHGAACLHSHITGVVAAGRRHGLGLALKQHQRLWALEHDLATITWTTDPLVRRNVAFNLHALGAQVAAYLPDHYGSMTDGLNEGDETDRFELRWDLLSDRAVRAAEGRLPLLDGAGLPAAVTDVGGLPVSTPQAGGSRVVALPADVEALRVNDHAAALAWRHAVRDAVAPALAEGAVVAGLTAAGALVLEATP